MDLRNDTTTLLVVSSLIRTSTDQRSFATPRSFSQLVTSFFGAMYQGILLYALCSLFFNISCYLRPIQSYSLLKKLKTNCEFIYSRINSSILLEYSFLFAFCTLFILVYISFLKKIYILYYAVVNLRWWAKQPTAVIRQPINNII